MAFDYQQAIELAQKVVERQEASAQRETNYKYPLVYPQAGHTIVMRPLFNPASGQILRLVNRHEKIACYRTYNQECPICQVMQQVKDVTGQDPFGRSKASRSRGVCFAQYISSTNPISKGNDVVVQPGEIILVMFPWSVYSQINTIIQAIAQTPTGMDQAFSHASSGLYIQITVSADFKYTTTNVPYMTFPTQQTDDDFIKMLESMDSLNEQVLPSTITEEVSKQVKEYTDAIYRQYIAPRTPQPVQGSQPVSMSSMTASPVTNGPMNLNPPVTQQVVSPTPVYTNNVVAPNQVPATPAPSEGRPACFGRHREGDPQCICCPEELVCIEKFNNEMPF